ncbi:MAG: ankyrin repeat domain-containing protein [Flavobacteriaceae bacterium]|nr:ankyrin repeat domain-containing protein [Flavobacteriaceae bacterium]
MIQKAILILCLIFTGLSLAQTKNIFLDRDFWKANPTIEIIDQKISEGNNVSELSDNGFDAVTNSILAKTPNDVVKYLLSQKGNDVNKLTHDKRTYVFWAAYKGNLELVEYLISNNARLDLKDSHNFSPLTFTAVAGQVNTKIYDLFINNGIDIKNDIDEHGANALLLIMGHIKDFTMVDYFVSKGLSIDSVDNDGNGVFTYVAKTGNKEMLEELIQKGLAYKNLNNNGGNSILMATKGSRKGYNSLEYFKYLESLGINPNVVNNHGETPIHNLAYGNEDKEVFNYFISKGVNVNQVNKEGNTALINATRRNSIETVSLLVNKTQNINHINNKGKSALTNSISNNSEIISFLLDNKADINIVDSKGNNLCYYLIKSFRAKNKTEFDNKMKLLIDNGLDFIKPQKNGNTLYHLAIEKNNIDLLKMISSFKIDINTKNKDGITPLHKAIMTAKDDKIIKYLLSLNADISIKTDFDETVYDLAKENELLKQNKIDISFLK